MKLWFSIVVLTLVFVTVAQCLPSDPSDDKRIDGNQFSPRQRKAGARRSRGSNNSIEKELISKETRASGGKRKRPKTKCTVDSDCLSGTGCNKRRKVCRASRGKRRPNKRGPGHKKDPKSNRNKDMHDPLVPLPKRY